MRASRRPGSSGTKFERDGRTAAVAREQVSTMPYASNAQLPDAVRNHLPEHAQDVFREAFDHAWREYAADPRREEIAFRVAWAAVKRHYVKAGDHWIERA